MNNSILIIDDIDIPIHSFDSKTLYGSPIVRNMRLNVSYDVKIKIKYNETLVDFFNKVREIYTSTSANKMYYANDIKKDMYILFENHKNMILYSSFITEFDTDVEYINITINPDFVAYDVDNISSIIKYLRREKLKEILNYP